MTNCPTCGALAVEGADQVVDCKGSMQRAIERQNARIEDLLSRLAVMGRREERLIKALRVCAQNDRSEPYTDGELRPSDGLTTQQAGVMGARFKTPREIAAVFLDMLSTDESLQVPKERGDA